ncbi:MAG TPA: VWA domain-containing protein [Blastocatellia bacterium]|nr:VWA domain-containing protein [Blastocatellia bacterium]
MAGALPTRVCRASFIALGLVLASLPVTGRSAKPVASPKGHVHQNGQEEDQTIRLTSDLVSLNVAVIDKDGHSIKSLKKSDFVAYEDGIKQQITNFAAAEEPFTVMLLLDVSGSTSEQIGLMKAAAKNFLSYLDQRDNVGVIAFSGGVELLADLGNTRADVQSSIDGIATAEGSEGHRFASNTGTSFYDALYSAVNESPLKRITGRKAIVCMTDGVDSSSRMHYPETARLVEKSDASVYFLELDTEKANLEALLRDRNDPGYANFSHAQIERYCDTYHRDEIDRALPPQMIPRDERKKINHGLYEIAHGELKDLAGRTGGRIYPVKTVWDLVGVFRQIADDLRAQYSIGYYPANKARDGRWRIIKVEVTTRGARVRTRPGYWAPIE